jgi:peptidoglycan/LPS O-acetylase OafA/YrhL
MLLTGAGACWFFACYEFLPRFTYVSEKTRSWPLIGGFALGALGCVLLLVAFLGINPKLLPRWVIYLGRISFGLYVYHGLAPEIINCLPIGHAVSFISPLFFLKTVLAVGLNILMAAISYRYFETPFLKIKKRYSVVESEPTLRAAGSLKEHIGV